MWLARPKRPPVLCARSASLSQRKAKVEATLAPPPRGWLLVTIDDGDDEAEAKEKALAEHVASHPESVRATRPRS